MTCNVNKKSQILDKDTITLFCQNFQIILSSPLLFVEIIGNNFFSCL